MARGRADLRTQLERQEKKILKMTEDLEKEKEIYKHLQEAERQEAAQKITDAYMKSDRSLEEVLDYLKGKADI